jgi:anti-anti-sigma factor
MDTGETPPGPELTTFTLRIGTRKAPMARIEVDGPIDRSSVPGIHAVLREFIGDRHVVIDLTGCTTIDEAGAAALASSLRAIRRAGGTTAIVGCQASVGRRNGVAEVGLSLEPPCATEAGRCVRSRRITSGS